MHSLNPPRSLCQNQRLPFPRGRHLPEAQRQQQTEPAAEHIDADVKEVAIIQYALLAEQLNALLKEPDAEQQRQNDADASPRRQPSPPALAASLPYILCISKAPSTAKSKLCMKICVQAGLNIVLKSL